jgi:muramidase (phage lysozyme)
LIAMQLTDALTLVPPRHEREEVTQSTPHLALMPLEDLQEFLRAPERDAAAFQLALPSIFEFFGKRGKATNEAKYAMQGVMEELAYEEAIAEEERNMNRGDSMLRGIAKWAVKKTMRFAANLIWKAIWRLTKWLIKEVVGGAIRLMFRWLVAPAMELFADFLLTPPGWIVAAAIGGALVGGYAIYKLFFEQQKSNDIPKPTKDEFEEAADRLLGETPSETAAAPIGAGTPAPSGPVTTVAAPVAPASSLAELLTKGESHAANPYNVVNRGAAHGYAAGTEPLEQMTIGQVMAAQNAKQFNAAGRYQIIRDTLASAFRALKLTGNELFDRNLQDRIFNEYLIGIKRRKIADYLAGRSNDLTGAVYAASQEWASVGVPKGLTTQSGAIANGLTTYYDNAGKNKASISPEQMAATLQKERERRLSMNSTQSQADQVTVKPGSALPATTTQQEKQAAAEAHPIGIQPPAKERTVIKDKRGNLVSVAM